MKQTTFIITRHAKVQVVDTGYAPASPPENPYETTLQLTPQGLQYTANILPSNHPSDLKYVATSFEPWVIQTVYPLYTYTFHQTGRWKPFHIFGHTEEHLPGRIFSYLKVLATQNPGGHVVFCLRYQTELRPLLESMGVNPLPTSADAYRYKWVWVGGTPYSSMTREETGQDPYAEEIMPDVMWTPELDEKVLAQYGRL